MKTRSIKTFLFCVIVASLTFVANCGSGGSSSGNSLSPSPAGLPRTHVVIVNDNDLRLQIIAEIASTSEQHSLGLMYRTSMEANEGMLFVFDSERPLSFWMKNTLIPLDMIFIDSDKRIVDINHDAQPENTVPFASSSPARYVLEVNGGYCVEHNINIGNLLEFDE
ncbi:MAG TPA: DUF192 domain-containing protein [bacterium]|nr:DUF192 domain-containing protein [bacterium]